MHQSNSTNLLLYNLLRLQYYSLLRLTLLLTRKHYEQLY
uniref:Uncharacterized protein n=1 Tax=Siphoviridae sp. cteoh1 TaxID=2826407 RepID=A0A8S5QLV3_9CAUD|nr:MAG TPA: hypothetical protein [Siphoviridae sp. cteoh1]